MIFRTILFFISVLLGAQRHLCLSVHDPRLSPGHLKPLGTGRPKHPIESALDYPSPQEFFSKYVDQKLPFIIRSGVKSSPAYNKWSNSYFQKHPEIMEMGVSVDRDKKELNNISEYRHMKFAKFLDHFQKDELYLVDGVKKQLQPDLLLPSPLRCKETRQHLQDTAMWYSSGGTKSLFSLTFRDEIVCVLRGSNEYLMVPYMKYKDRFTEIKGDAGIRGVDVDSVDFGKYPQLEDIEWQWASLREGDCMYLPYKWASQMNSYGGKTKESLFVTFSFDHIHEHKPKDCSIDPSQARLDKYQFSEIEQEEMKRKEADMIRKHKHGNETHAGHGDGDDDHVHDGTAEYPTEEENVEAFLTEVKMSLKAKKSLTLNFNQFVEAFKKSSLSTTDLSSYKLPDSFGKINREIFDLIDIDKDGLLSFSDFKSIKKSKRYEDIMNDLAWRVRNWETYIEEFLESYHHGKTNEEFDADRKARELRKKLSIHDPMEL